MGDHQREIARAVIRYVPVPPQARAFCGIGYAFQAGAGSEVVRLSAVMPQVQVVVRGGLHHALGAGGAADNFALTIVGPTNAASEISIEPHSRFFGVSLTPLGWELAVRVSADEAADRLIEGAAIWGAREQRLLAEQATGAVPDAEILRTLFEFVVTRANRFRSADSQRHAVVAAWLARAGHVTLDDLTRTLDVSPRQAARVTAQIYGASPKQLLMKYRTLRLAAVAALRPAAPAFEPDYEPGDGFYDQSHMVTDFKRFTGFTPAQFARDHGAFAREMLMLRWRAGARTPLSLWS